jgi:membrane protein DedA with SNARE-associated domain
VARRLVEQLLSQSPRPLYLTCRSSLGVFYQRFGFRVLASGELTPYFRRLQRLAAGMMQVFRGGETLLVMRLDL